MSNVSAKLVKELRDQTGAGMMDCKKALTESEGNIDKAIEFLRKKGLKNVEKRAGKVAAEGTVLSYIHAGGRIGVLLELNCETDFVGKGEDFQSLAKDIAMHIAWANPKYVSREEVPQDIVEKEKEIFKSQLKPEQQKMADKILPGKVEKFYESVCLLEQVDVKDPSGKKKILDIINEQGAKMGEKLSLRRFVRFEVGEGIEKEESNYADEVAQTVASFQ